VPGRQALGKVYFAECLGLALGKVFFLILDPNFFVVPCVSIISFTVEFGEILTLFGIFG